MTDWAAQHSTQNSANAGLDMAMPGDGMGNNNFYWGSNLVSAVNRYVSFVAGHDFLVINYSFLSSGSVPQKRLDDMVERILASWYYVGQDQGYPSVSFNSWGGNGGPNVQGDH